MGLLQALGDSGQAFDRFKRITGGDKPPDSIKLQAPQSDQTDQAMGRMGRIERAPQQADPLAATMGRQKPHKARGKTNPFHPQTGLI